MLVFRSHGRKRCLWCTGASLVIVARFRLKPGVSQEERHPSPFVEESGSPGDSRPRVGGHLAQPTGKSLDISLPPDEIDPTGIDAIIKKSDDGMMEVIESRGIRIPSNLLLALSDLVKDRVGQGTLEIRNGCVYLADVLTARGERYLLGRLLLTRDGTLKIIESR